MFLTCFLHWSQEKLNRGNEDFCFYTLAWEQSLSQADLKSKKRSNKENKVTA